MFSLAIKGLVYHQLVPGDSSAPSILSHAAHAAETLRLVANQIQTVFFVIVNVTSSN